MKDLSPSQMQGDWFYYYTHGDPIFQDAACIHSVLKFDSSGNATRLLEHTIGTQKYTTDLNA